MSGVSIYPGHTALIPDALGGIVGRHRLDQQLHPALGGRIGRVAKKNARQVNDDYVKWYMDDFQSRYGPVDVLFTTKIGI